MTGKRVIRRLALPAALAVGTVLVASTAGADVADNKTYVVTIDGSTAGAAPNTYAGDTNADISITIHNSSPSQQLGSANVTVPAPYVVDPLEADDAVAGGPVVELRNLAIAPGGSKTIVVTVDVRTCVPSAPPAFLFSAKQSNDYRGTGNDFFQDPATPSDLQVGVSGTCLLAFVAQPTDAEAGATITSVRFNPAGAPITVEVRDAGNTGRATHSTAVVSLAAANASVPSPVLGGTVSATAVAGLATFSPGPTLATSAFDYTLTASSPPLLSSAPSATFDVVDDQVNCPAGQPCAQTANANKNGQTVSASFGTGGSSTNLLVSIGAADVPAFNCPTYPRQPGQLVSQFLFDGDLGADRIGTMTATIPSASRPLNSYEVCWAAPYSFTTETGAPAAQQGTKPGTGLPLYVGVLADCPRRGTATLPCVSDRSFDRSTSTVTIVVRATGQDPWRY